MNIKQTAKKLQRMGGDEDTILAHINPMEAAMLKEGGGSGKRNPKTGLLSFGGYEGEGSGADFGGYDGPDRDAGLGAALAEALGQQANPASGMGMTPEINYVAPEPSSFLQGAAKLSPALNIFGLGALAPILQGAAYLDRNRQNTNIGSGYGGSAWGGTPNAGQAESGYGGDYAMSGRDNPGAYGQGAGLLGAPLAQTAALPTYSRPAFISKWGKPRSGFTSAYSPLRRGLLGG